MNKFDIEVGALYVIAGQGPMRVRVLHARPVECETLDALTYWASYEQVVRKVDRSYVDGYVSALKERGIVGPDYQPQI